MRIKDNEDRTLEAIPSRIPTFCAYSSVGTLRYVLHGYYVAVSQLCGLCGEQYIISTI